MMTKTYLRVVSDNTMTKRANASKEQRMMEIKQSLSRSDLELSLFDCMELNEQVEELRQEALIEITIWKTFKRLNQDVCVEADQTNLFIMERFEAQNAVRAYLDKRSTARQFQAWYLESSTPKSWSPYAPCSPDDDPVA